MSKRPCIGITIALSLLSVIFLFVACKKKEAPEAPKNLTAVACDDSIRLSWDASLNTDHYRIAVDFHTIDEVGEITDKTFSVVLGSTSDTYYMDAYPFEWLNHYKVTAVNEYGISPASEVSFNQPTIHDTWDGYSYHGIALFPNPTDNYLFLNALSCDIHRVRIENFGGQVMLDSYQRGDHYNLDVSQYEEGVYHAHVFTDDGEIVKRFVVAHP